MPYKNIVFVKLLIELLHDYRFMELLDDKQKLLYFCLLMLAGKTQNKIYNSSKFIKRSCALEMDEEVIEQGVIHILTIFPKIKKNNDFLQFENFEYIHGFRIERNRNPIHAIDKDKDKDKMKIKIRKEENIVPLTEEQQKELHEAMTKLKHSLKTKTVV